LPFVHNSNRPTQYIILYHKEQTSGADWAVTLRRHSDLFRAATSASSQVIPILNKSLLTLLLQLVHGRPGPLSNRGTSQCNACRGVRWWSIRITCPSQQSLLSLSMSSILCCPVLTLTSSLKLKIANNQQSHYTFTNMLL